MKIEMRKTGEPDLSLAADILAAMANPAARRAPDTPAPSSYDVVKEWHRDIGHVGRFEHCYERPCLDVVRAAAPYPWQVGR